MAIQENLAICRKRYLILLALELKIIWMQFDPYRHSQASYWNAVTADKTITRVVTMVFAMFKN